MAILVLMMKYLTTGDGKKVVVNKMWTKPSFDRLVNHATQYGIQVAQFDPAEKGFGKKRSFALEYLNGYVPPVPPKKSQPRWLWLLLVLLIGGIVAAVVLFNGPKTEVVEVEKIVEKEIIVRDTVYMVLLHMLMIYQVENLYLYDNYHNPFVSAIIIYI